LNAKVSSGLLAAKKYCPINFQFSQKSLNIKQKVATQSFTIHYQTAYLHLHVLSNIQEQRSVDKLY